MRYIGRKDGIQKNVQEIYYELEQFYQEFAGIMLNPLSNFEKKSKPRKSQSKMSVAN